MYELCSKLTLRARSTAMPLASVPELAAAVDGAADATTVAPPSFASASFASERTSLSSSFSIAAVSGPRPALATRAFAAAGTACLCSPISPIARAAVRRTFLSGSPRAATTLSISDDASPPALPSAHRDPERTDASASCSIAAARGDHTRTSFSVVRLRISPSAA